MCFPEAVDDHGLTDSVPCSLRGTNRYLDVDDGILLLLHAVQCVMHDSLSELLLERVDDSLVAWLQYTGCVGWQEHKLRCRHVGDVSMCRAVIHEHQYFSFLSLKLQLKEQ